MSNFPSIEDVFKFVLENKETFILGPIAWVILKILEYLKRLAQTPLQLEQLNDKFDRWHKDTTAEFKNIKEDLKGVDEEIKDLKDNVGLIQRTVLEHIINEKKG